MTSNPKPVSPTQTSNENSFVCPYRMNDARAFTDYRSQCMRDATLVNASSMFPSEFDYRMYLTRNAESLMSYQRNNALKVYECPPCYPKQAYGTMLPEKHMQQCDDVSCDVQTVDERGLGIGRNYNPKE
jgi:hypothetical protein